jgi:hypothetical protein
MLLSTLTHFFLEGRSLWLLLLVVNHQHYRSLVCVCVSSSYRLFVNSSCTHIHTYKKQNWFFSLLLSYSRLSFFFSCSFLYSSSMSTIVVENVFFQLFYHVRHHLFLSYHIENSRYVSFFILT